LKFELRICYIGDIRFSIENVSNWKSGFHFLVAFWHWAAANRCCQFKKKVHIPAQLWREPRWYV